MTVAKSVDKLGLGKDKLGSSKSEERGKCPKKFVLSKEKPVSKALGLGSSARGVEAKEAKYEKKPREHFLCHGLHKLQKCPTKSIIEGDNGVDKKPKKLGSSKGKVEAKRAKRSKKKQVKCFLCHGPHEL
ncbi:hypothetical protein J1N35_007425 [Gossypium stocksii]|uniref:Uncharacterized protein n=1 Tax=Gossypium stocksii TaxID=47602 RepID=A0A9D3W7I1_9ROSI|nr:hypothetical protein J1N35_007425 [Gossypium stocksii]